MEELQLSLWLQKWNLLLSKWKESQLRLTWFDRDINSSFSSGIVAFATDS